MTDLDRLANALASKALIHRMAEENGLALRERCRELADTITVVSSPKDQFAYFWEWLGYERALARANNRTIKARWKERIAHRAFLKAKEKAKVAP